MFEFGSKELSVIAIEPNIMPVTVVNVVNDPAFKPVGVRSRCDGLSAVDLRLAGIAWAVAQSLATKHQPPDSRLSEREYAAMIMQRFAHFTLKNEGDIGDALEPV